jgi:hypothetical protein
MNNPELHKIAPTLMNMKREVCFVVPEHYFENLPTQVEYLLLLKKQEKYITPEHYFDKLPNAISNLNLQVKSGVFSVPEGYFDTLPMRVMSQIIEKPKLVFDAPQGYFDELPQLVQQRIYEEEQSKKWFVWKPAYSYTLATISACFMLFLGVKLFFNDKPIKQLANSKTKQVDTITSNQVAVVNTKAGLQIKVSDDTQKKILQHINEGELQAIDETILLEELANASQEPNINQEKSDEQIQDFLIENNIDERILIDAVN